MATKRETARGFAISETSPMTITNSTTETTVFSYTVEGGKMGASKALRFRIVCSLTTGLLPPNITVKVKLGSTTMTIITALSLAISVTDKPFMIEGEIKNKTAGTQFVWAKVTQYANGVPVISSTGSAMDCDDWTVNTTVNQTFSATVQFSALSLTSTLTFKNADLETT